MKLAPEQLASQLESSLQPVYLVFGDEPLLIDESCRHIRETARGRGYSERRVFHVDTHFSWDQLGMEADSYSLFGDKTLLEVRLPSGKPGDRGSKALIRYLDNPPQDKILLIQSGKIEFAQQKTKWFTTIQQQGATIQAWPVNEKQLPGWIQQRGRQKGLELDRTLATMIADKVEGNLLAAQQELEKLLLLYGKSRLDEKQVIEAITDSNRYNIYQLADEALAGHAHKVQKVLETLRQEGVEVILILWALSRDLRTLAKIAPQGNSPGEPVGTAVLKRHGVWASRQAHYLAALRRHPPRAFYQMLCQAAKIDRMIKGLEKDFVWESLGRLAAWLAGTPVLRVDTPRHAITG